MRERILSVSQLNEYVRKALAADPMLRGIRLKGEISNFKAHSTGHLYFSLKDQESRIACVMFRTAAMGLGMKLRDGMEVIATGSAALYPAAGQYQFYVDSLREDGIGEKYAAFEALKNALQQEGIFDAALKKPLPLLPSGVGIVTSPTGAVLHDIMNVTRRRHPGIQLTLMPALVQGEGAAASIVQGIEALDGRPGIDVIILGRGGGSIEELWAFNEERVARAIFACKTPVISAVGHETDFTIADFVADARAATPSQAAEMAVPLLGDLQETLLAMALRMARAQGQRMALKRARLHQLAARLSAHQPQRRILGQRAALLSLSVRLTAQGERRLLESRMALHALRGRLSALSPERILARGYALVTGEDGRVLSAAEGMAAGDGIHIRLHRGQLTAEVREVFHGAEKGR